MQATIIHFSDQHAFFLLGVQLVVALTALISLNRSGKALILVLSLFFIASSATAYIAYSPKDPDRFIFVPTEPTLKAVREMFILRRDYMRSGLGLSAKSSVPRPEIVYQNISSPSEADLVLKQTSAAALVQLRNRRVVVTPQGRASAVTLKELISSHGDPRIWIADTYLGKRLKKLDDTLNLSVIVRPESYVIPADPPTASGVFLRSLFSSDPIDLLTIQGLRMDASLPEHKAYPLLAMGIMHLRGLFFKADHNASQVSESVMQFSDGELRCALESFESARTLLKGSRNQTIKDIIANNLAVTQVFVAFRENQLQKLRSVGKIFRELHMARRDRGAIENSRMGEDFIAKTIKQNQVYIEKVLGRVRES